MCIFLARAEYFGNDGYIGSIRQVNVFGTRGLVGYDACSTRRKSPVRFWACVFFYRATVHVSHRGITCACRLIPVPVAQLDKASDHESEDWEFKSLQEYFFPDLLEFFVENALGMRFRVQPCSWRNG